MAKRKLEFESDIPPPALKRLYYGDSTDEKHSLDSDEEDETEDCNHLNVDDIEGEEEGISRQAGDEYMSAFNMQEELEEGHFDKDGHFIWNNEKEIRDNWLDNIDWQKIKTCNLDSKEKVLVDDSDSEAEKRDVFDEIKVYKQILNYMKPNENVNKTIQRLGGDSNKLSSVERLNRKKIGTLNKSEDVTKLTELANKILTEKGNMDIYQETYESITKKIDASTENKSVCIEPELDMFADDFSKKDKEKFQIGSDMLGKSSIKNEKETLWEFKWAQDNVEIEGPFTTSQMLKWKSEQYFKSNVWVRKLGVHSNFYSLNRIDFDLYL